MPRWRSDSGSRGGSAARRVVAHGAAYAAPRALEPALPEREIPRDVLDRRGRRFCVSALRGRDGSHLRCADDAPPRHVGVKTRAETTKARPLRSFARRQRRVARRRKVELRRAAQEFHRGAAHAPSSTKHIAHSAGSAGHRCCSIQAMATRSEQLRAQTERAASTAKDKPKVVELPREEAGHAEKKAIYAREEGVALDHRSRKSTRKSANHARTDSTVLHAEQMQESSPQQSFERTWAKASRVGGGGAS
jgi:hypothetical protein